MPVRTVNNDNKNKESRVLKRCRESSTKLEPQFEFGQFQIDLMWHIYVTACRRRLLDSECPLCNFKVSFAYEAAKAALNFQYLQDRNEAPFGLLHIHHPSAAARNTWYTIYAFPIASGAWRNLDKRHGMRKPRGEKTKRMRCETTNLKTNARS